MNFPQEFQSVLKTLQDF
ncbi:MAG: hypothetical protein EBU41_05740 [Actinobacteria bacterium]|nr:hypothetical protein [Actinomycetota bacterium]